MRRQAPCRRTETRAKGFCGRRKEASKANPRHRLSAPEVGRPARTCRWTAGRWFIHEFRKIIVASVLGVVAVFGTSVLNYR